MGDFTSQGLTTTAWAFATASQSDVSLFAALATVPPLVWRGRLPGVPVFPSLLFETHFSIIFEDRIFWILDLTFGGFGDPNLHFVWIFVLIFFLGLHFWINCFSILS